MNSILSGKNTLPSITIILSSHQLLPDQQWPESKYFQKSSSGHIDNKDQSESVFVVTNGKHLSTTFRQDKFSVNRATRQPVNNSASIQIFDHSKQVHTLDSGSFENLGPILERQYTQGYQELFRAINPDKLASIASNIKDQLAMMNCNVFAAANETVELNLPYLQSAVYNLRQAIYGHSHYPEPKDLERYIADLHQKFSNISNALQKDMQLLQSVECWAPPIESNHFYHLPTGHKHAMRIAMLLRVFFDLAPQIIEKTLPLFQQKVGNAIQQWQQEWEKNSDTLIAKQKEAMHFYSSYTGSAQ